MSNMKKWNYILSVVALLLGIGIIALATQLPSDPASGDPGAGFWPKLMGFILAGLAILLAVRTACNPKKEEEKTFALVLPANKRVYKFMLVIVAYCVLLYLLGFVVASLLFIPCTMYMLGMRDKWTILLVDVIVVAAIYIIFSVLLKTPLPLPIFLR